MNIQPYQEESNRLKKAEALPGNIIKGAIGLSGSGALANKILPLINQFIPENIMQKGLAKINPKIGSFVDQALNMGFGADEVREFLKEKLVTGAEKKEEKKPPVHPLQEFETNYPEIAQALANTMKQGQSPEVAAGILKTSSVFGKLIKKLEKDIGKNFVDYILELFGPRTGSMQQPQNIQQQNQQEQFQGMPEQGSTQGAGLDQQIVAALDKILKM